MERLEDRLVPAPTVLDPNLEVRTVVAGLDSPTSMAFLGPNDFFVLEKNTGQVKRVIHGFEQTVLDLPVNNSGERGLLGIAVHPSFATNPEVYLYWTQSSIGFDPDNPNDFSAGADTGVGANTPLLGNRVDRFFWDGSQLTFFNNLIRLRALQPANPPTEMGQATNHNGGVIRFGPDNQLYIFIGDVGRRGFTQNILVGQDHNGMDDQFGGPEPDDAHLTGVILRLGDDGSTPSDNPFFDIGAAISQIAPEAGANLQKIFSYGHRNSFGMAFDPFTGSLWLEENGDNSFTELNLVEAGMNGGWIQIAGPIERVAEFKRIETGGVPGLEGLRGLQQARFSPDELPNTPDEAFASLFLPEGAFYSDPEFSWKFEVAPANIGFAAPGSALGEMYEGDLFVGAARVFLAGGQIWRFRLNSERTGFVFDDPRLDDLVADNRFTGGGTFDITESESLLFGINFGIATDIQTGPNGSLYVVSNTNGAVYEIRERVTPPVGTHFTAILNGDQEPVPVGGTLTRAHGVARFVLNEEQTELRYEAFIFGLDFTGDQTAATADNLVAAHIHAPAPPGVNAGVVFGFFGTPFNETNPNDVVVTPFTTGAGGTVTGKWDLTEGNNTTLAAQLPNILAGNSYINFHTVAFPGGEIRGQILPNSTEIGIGG